MFVFSLLVWGLLGLIGGQIAARKGYAPGLGIFLAILLGPIGVVVFLVLPMTKAGREQAERERQIKEEDANLKKSKTCPKCGRYVNFTCRVCPHCAFHFEC